MDRIYGQSDMKTPFTPVTDYFKLNVMAKRQMCRQAAKMLHPCLVRAVTLRPKTGTALEKTYLKVSKAGQKISTE